MDWLGALEKSASLLRSKHQARAAIPLIRMPVWCHYGIEGLLRQRKKFSQNVQKALCRPFYSRKMDRYQRFNVCLCLVQSWPEHQLFIMVADLSWCRFRPSLLRTRKYWETECVMIKSPREKNGQQHALIYRLILRWLKLGHPKKWTREVKMQQQHTQLFLLSYQW